jgi:hypothetical protein
MSTHYGSSSSEKTSNSTTDAICRASGKSSNSTIDAIHNISKGCAKKNILVGRPIRNKCDSSDQSSTIDAHESHKYSPPHVRDQPSYSPPHVRDQPSYSPHVRDQPSYSPPHVRDQPSYSPPHVRDQPSYSPHVRDQPSYSPHVRDQPSYSPHVRSYDHDYPSNYNLNHNYPSNYAHAKYDPGVSYFNSIITPITGLTPQFSGHTGCVEFRMRRKNKVVTLQWEPFSGSLSSSGISCLIVAQSVANTPPYPISFHVDIQYKGLDRSTRLIIDPHARLGNIRFNLNTDGSTTEITAGDAFIIYGGAVTWIVD